MCIFCKVINDEIDLLLIQRNLNLLFQQSILNRLYY